MTPLDENIKRMTEFYQDHDIRFVKEGNIVKVVEDTPFYLNDNPDLKAGLRVQFNMVFNPANLWHINEVGISALEKKLLKFSPTKPVDELKTELDVYISQITEQDLRESIQAFVVESEYYSGAPGAKFYHHAYNNGLLEHTLQVLDLCSSMKNVVENEYELDTDLLIAGGILHDIGKIYCYESNEGIISLTDTQLIHDHIIHGVKKVTEKIRSTKLDDLIHIIASHHGQKEWGSPVEPQSKEAWMIHFADNLSSKILGG